MKKIDKLYFPTVVDNFFDNPDKIREYALSLEYKPDPTGSWPGERTESLHTIDNELYVAIITKILSIFSDFAYQNVKWQNGKIQFHKNKSTGDKDVDKGWIHIDDNFQLAAVCYLNPGINDMDSGTSIFSLKKGKTFLPYQRQHYKHMFVKGDNVDKETYKKKLKEFNSDYDETIRIGNVYNRIVCYGGPEHHCLNGLPENEERLTMLLFMDGIEPEDNRFPTTRIRNSMTDNFINERIDYLNENKENIYSR